MPLLSSKIERPPPQSLGESVDARITRTSCNTPPPPFNPAATVTEAAPGRGARGTWEPGGDPAPASGWVDGPSVRLERAPRHIVPYVGTAGGGGVGDRAGSFGIYAERAGGQLSPTASPLRWWLPVVGAEVVLLQRHGLAGTLAEGVVLRFGVAAGREGRRAGVVGRLDPDVPVHLHAGTGRDELAGADVILKAHARGRLE